MQRQVHPQWTARQIEIDSECSEFQILPILRQPVEERVPPTARTRQEEIRDASVGTW